MTVRETAAAIINMRPAYENILDYYLRIFILQEESGKTVNVERIEIGEDALRVKLDAGMPLIELPDFRIDMKASESLFVELGKIGGNETLASGFEKMSAAMSDGRLNGEELFSAILGEYRDYFASLGESLGIDPAIPRFAAYNSVKPSIALCAERLAEHLKNEGPEYSGHCPVCGSLPCLSLLADEGRRKLVCGFCDHEWPVRRLFCPYCRNTEQKELGYIYSEEEPHYRIDTCGKCRKYLKAADLRNFPYSFHTGLEQASTLHLDMIARKEGYDGGTESFIGLN